MPRLRLRIAILSLRLDSMIPYHHPSIHALRKLVKKELTQPTSKSYGTLFFIAKYFSCTPLLTITITIPHPSSSLNPSLISYLFTSPYAYCSVVWLPPVVTFH